MDHGLQILEGDRGANLHADPGSTLGEQLREQQCSTQTRVQATGYVIDETVSPGELDRDDRRLVALDEPGETRRPDTILDGAQPAVRGDAACWERQDRAATVEVAHQ
jgi:hypothetical protein